MDESLDAAEKEQVYVHTVYNEIASHFSQTRYKPWPIVERFLKDRQKGTIGIDVGCGNGKYLGINKDVFIIGSDRSDGLIGCAKEFGHEVMVSDGLSLPHPNDTFDFAISIAVIHHFSTPERRTEAIRHILSKVKSGGEALIYVWALEQENSRRGYKDGMPQDVLVPWVLQKKQPKKVKEKKQRKKRAELQNKDEESSENTLDHDIKDQKKDVSQDEVNKVTEEVEQKEDNTKFRYYHLYKKGELEENAVDAGGIVAEQGYERDNWYAVIRKP